MSQEELARRITKGGLRFHQSTINKIEAVIRKVGVGEAVAIAKALDVTVEVLISLPDDDHSLNSRRLWNIGASMAEELANLVPRAQLVEQLRTDLLRAVENFDALDLRIKPSPESDDMTGVEFMGHLAHLDVVRRFLVELDSVVHEDEALRDAFEGLLGTPNLGTGQLTISESKAFSARPQGVRDDRKAD